MIRAGLARATASYAGVTAPFPPETAYPELRSLFGEKLRTGKANPAYAAVRSALRALGLDAANFGQPGWNPLGELTPRGGTVVLKPNFIRHWNPREGEDVDCVITHGAILRAAADYAQIAAGPEGRVTLAEAPQMDCDWDRIREIAGLDELVAEHASAGRSLHIVDLRREAVDFEDGIIVSLGNLDRPAHP